MGKETTKSDLATNWVQSRYFRNICVAVLILLAALLGNRLLPFLGNIANFVFSVTFPFFLSLIIYYFVRPIVKFLEKKISIYLAIAIVYALIIGFISFIVVFISPHVMTEINLLKTINLNTVVENTYRSLGVLKRFHIEIVIEDQIKAYAVHFLSNIYAIFMNNIVGFIASFANILFDVVIVPLILFYILRDDVAIYRRFCKMIPKSYSKKVEKMLQDIDQTLMHFITARVIISACVSAMLFLSYLIIGINYSYILAMIAFIFYIIPSIGWTLASILPLIVGFSMSMTMGLEIIVISMAGAAVEGVWLSPEIMGRKLTIHPLTVIFILIVAGYLFGIFGLLVVTPVFALLKVTATHIYKYIFDGSRAQ